MGVMLDTSVLIAAEKGRFQLDRVLTAAGDEPVVIATITVAELLHGVERAAPVQTRERERRGRFVEQVIASFDIAELGLPAARVHARIWAQLSAKGQPIGSHDLIIAATALSLGFSLAILNLEEFRRVPDLTIFPL